MENNKFGTSRSFFIRNPFRLLFLYGYYFYKVAT